MKKRKCYFLLFFVISLTPTIDYGGFICGTGARDKYFTVEAKSKRDVEVKGWLVELANRRGLLFFGGK
jgi:hypothetical protein